MFKFGGGTCLQSKGEYSLPVVIAGKEATVKTDVVESDIPLLLSRTAMKKAVVKTDLENDTATIMGKEVALNLTTSGHYCIPIDKSEEVPVENVCAVNLDILSKQDRIKTLLKLHRQFVDGRYSRLWNCHKKKTTMTDYELVQYSIYSTARTRLRAHKVKASSTIFSSLSD